MIRLRPILNTLSALMLFLAAMMLIPAAIAYNYGEGDFQALLMTAVFTLLTGLVGFFTTRHTVELRPRDGFIIVTFGWIIFAAIGAVPFKIAGFIPAYTDAFFETMSGFTTTGASVLNNIESLPHGLLFWRSLTHWLGGMGIILLSLAILPLLGVGGMQLFKAEVPGPTPDRLTPRIRHTAELLWGVYVLISAAEVFALKFAGMNWFDSFCHTFGTMATGGFSTKAASIGHYHSALIDYIIVIFMIMAGTNFALHYRALSGKPFIYWKDREAVFFIAIIGIGVLLVGVDVFFKTEENLFLSLQHTVFQIVSILTTTGYTTADYEQWSFSSQVILFLLMFLGGCAGSTGGGMKIIRSMILLKFGLNELKRLLHPQAVLSVRIGDMPVSREITSNITGFFLFQMLLFILGIVFMSHLGLDIESAFGSVAATINNIGPGLGSVGPTDNYAHIPNTGKWFLSFLMLAGRLEIFTVIVLFTPYFWKK